jgi:hypothetical protein
MADEEIDNIDYSQYSVQKLYDFLNQELTLETRELILSELSKRLKSSFEDTVSEASKPPVVPPQYRKENVSAITPNKPSGGNISGGSQNDGNSTILIIVAVVVGIGMLMAGM